MTATSISTASTQAAVTGVVDASDPADPTATVFAVNQCTLADSRSYSILSVFPIYDSGEHYQ
jgi:hypothetical protein